MKRMIFTLTLLTLVSCGNGAGQPGPAAPQQKPLTSGEVIETMDVDSYTYIRLRTDSGETWLATSPVSVEAGNTVSFTGGMLMKDFYSSALDRTFADILFVGNVDVAGVQGAPVPGDGSPPPVVEDPHAGLKTMPHVTGEPAVAGPPVATLTVTGLLADPAAYAGKRIAVQGTVVKFNMNIMDKHWVTLEDGAGSAPDKQLTATTTQTVSVGDELTLTGTVRIDVDLGFGYAYSVLLEDATTD